jgi:hypothetical protein
VEGYFILVPLALTSLAVAVIERRRQPRPAASLWAAVLRAAETIGLTLLFFAGNVALGASITLCARALDLPFLSIYLSADVALLVLSLLQALVYQRWREGRPGR